MGTGEVEGTARRMGGGAELENAGENGPTIEVAVPARDSVLEPGLATWTGHGKQSQVSISMRWAWVLSGHAELMNS